MSLKTHLQKRGRVIHFHNSQCSNIHEIIQHEHKSFRNFTSPKIQAHVKTIVIKEVFPHSFTPLKIRAHVNRINTMTPTFFAFTPLKIRVHIKHIFEHELNNIAFTSLKVQAHVKPQISLFNFESWMSLSEVHLSLNEQYRHCVSS